MASKTHDGMTDQTHVNIARDGRVPKRGYLTAAPVHNGMHQRTRDGRLLFGVTDHAVVESGGLPSVDGKMLPVHQSTVGKRLADSAAVPGHRHRRTVNR
jgi:hypothetical protein